MSAKTFNLNTSKTTQRISKKKSNYLIAKVKSHLIMGVSMFIIMYGFFILTKGF